MLSSATSQILESVNVSRRYFKIIEKCQITQRISQDEHRQIETIAIKSVQYKQITLLQLKFLLK